MNYIEANQSPSRYFGANLSRLSAVRQKYDPGRIMFSGLNFRGRPEQSFRLFEQKSRRDRASDGALPSGQG